MNEDEKSLRKEGENRPDANPAPVLYPAEAETAPSAEIPEPAPALREDCAAEASGEASDAETAPENGEAADSAETPADSADIGGTAAQESNPQEYVWNFGAQLALEKDREKKSGKKGALVYAIVVTSLFVLCFGLLAGLLLYGYTHGFGGEVRTVYTDRVVYVRDNTASSGLLTTQEIAAKVVPSTVGVSVTKENATGTGTGIVLDTDGNIVTNYHVIEGAKTVTVVMSDTVEFSAEVVGGDEMSDIAVIRIQPGSYRLQPAEFGDSDELLVGDTVVAIGNAGGLELFGTVTRGVISGINREIAFYDENNLVSKRMTLIQTDAMINPGNSGGPLVDEYGRVIGINFMKYVNNEFEGLGFAIPSNGATAIIREILETGSYSGDAVAQKGATLGIKVMSAPVTKGEKVVIDELTGASVTAEADGVLVIEISGENSSAYGYLQKYDIITALNGAPVTSSEQIINYVTKSRIGDSVTLTVVRDGKTLDVTIPFK